jgi:hypothetical protein
MWGRDWAWRRGETLFPRHYRDEALQEGSSGQLRAGGKGRKRQLPTTQEHEPRAEKVSHTCSAALFSSQNERVPRPNPLIFSNTPPDHLRTLPPSPASPLPRVPALQRRAASSGSASIRLWSAAGVQRKVLKWTGNKALGSHSLIQRCSRQASH